MKRTQNRLIYLLFLIPSITFSQKYETGKMIRWDENRPLTWNDFKGPVDRRSSFYASTCAGIYLKIEQSGNGDITVIAETFFDPAKSWYVKKYGNEKLLEHEQRHFDIKEIYARRFIKRVLEADLATERKPVEKIQKIYRQTLDEMNDFDDLYDRETKHSVNKEQQIAWNHEIKRLLEKYRAYDRKEISLFIP
ncbi:MAG: hypothetical protein K0B08_04380 [Bacteroidales bacterium]|nr:hypothetical protein [Bacteroidales bacterium]